MSSLSTTFNGKTALQLESLSLLQRLLMVTDGTVTHTLETITREPIQVVKLSEATYPLDNPIETLALEAGQSVIDRKILLQGQHSRKNWLYAESILIPHRLPIAFQEDLLHTQEPIGKLWSKHKIETFKEIVAQYQEPLASLVGYFNLQSVELMLGRTYRVLSNQQPVMMITEKFPASFFTS